MKLKNMWKRFWTLDVHNHEGFTLVELIIVIAILAILSTGAIAGYSAYVESANKTADQALVAEIKNVLTLYSYSNLDLEATGYIILNYGEEPVTDDGSFVVNAMKEAYGENWKDVLRLKYASWAKEGNYGNLVNSGLASMNANQVADTVTGLTHMAATVISSNAPEAAIGIISTMFGAEGQSIANELEKYKNDPSFSTVASNLLVKYFAEDMSRGEIVDGGDVTGISEMSKIGMGYATLVAMANSDSPYKSYAQEKVDQFDAAMAQLAEKEKNDNTTKVTDELGAMLGELYSDDYEVEAGKNFGTAFMEFASADNSAAMYGVIEAMGLVSSISNSFTGDALKDPLMFSSSSMLNAMNLYLNVGNGIAVSIEHGVITVIPTIVG